MNTFLCFVIGCSFVTDVRNTIYQRAEFQVGQRLYVNGIASVICGGPHEDEAGVIWYGYSSKNGIVRHIAEDDLIKRVKYKEYMSYLRWNAPKNVKQLKISPIIRKMTNGHDGSKLTVFWYKLYFESDKPLPYPAIFHVGTKRNIPIETIQIHDEESTKFRIDTVHISLGESKHDYRMAISLGDPWIMQNVHTKMVSLGKKNCVLGLFVNSKYNPKPKDFIVTYYSMKPVFRKKVITW